MLPMPSALQTRFEQQLRMHSVPNNLQWTYKKWLRYYLDFCEKYHSPSRQKESLPLFIRKLQEKKQTKDQQEQAMMATNVYYEILEARDSNKEKPALNTVNPKRISPFNDKNLFYIDEAADRPVQHENISPPIVRDADSSPSIHNSTNTSGLSGIARRPSVMPHQSVAHSNFAGFKFGQIIPVIEPCFNFNDVIWGISVDEKVWRFFVAAGHTTHFEVKTPFEEFTGFQFFG